MFRTAALGIVLATLSACAGGYCPVDRSGLQAPALWSVDGRAPTKPDDHGGAPSDPGPRR